MSDSLPGTRRAGSTYPYRRAVRPADERLVAGVSQGLADHLGVPVLAVRIAFVVATWFNGAGIVAYLLLWRFMPLQRPELAPGLESATRRGLRTGGRPSALDMVQGAALASIGVGVLVALQVSGRGLSGPAVLPLLVAVVGVALIWRQFDDASLGRWIRQTRGSAFAARIALGIVLVGFAAVYLVTQDRGWSAVLDLAAAMGAALVGVALILGPWLYKLIGDLDDERRERVRSQERADVAAHLHDSVLQTLALLQKNAGDAAQVATLARRQERELRSWLYGGEEAHDDSFAAAIRAVATEVETLHQVPVEAVVVGDTALDPDVAALVRAAREAMVNAAKHARVDRIDVYAEASQRTAQVFVRDRGVGFDPDDVAEDRMGVRGSIVDRVERHRGTATIRSAPGEGTEVALSVPVRGDEPVPEVRDDAVPEVRDDAVPEVRDDAVPEVRDDAVPEVREEPVPVAAEEPEPAGRPRPVLPPPPPPPPPAPVAEDDTVVQPAVVDDRAPDDTLHDLPAQAAAGRPDDEATQEIPIVRTDR